MSSAAVSASSALAKDASGAAVHVVASAAAGGAMGGPRTAPAEPPTPSPPSTSTLPVFDLSPFLEGDPNSQQVQQLCQALAGCLHETSALVVRDPRCPHELNDSFLDLMERYFSQPDDVKMQDVREQLSYQVGATPGGVEKPRCLGDPAVQEAAAALPEEHRPITPTGPDPKWRFFWRVGERPQHTQYGELNAEPVVPAAFADEWSAVMDAWGHKLLSTVLAVAEMAARGLGLEASAFTRRMHLGPHLLAPTGTDLQRHGALDTVFAGYHYDLNFLTIHGCSRFPGLFVWLRSGQRMPVRIPPGCLLLQAGKQMEWLTGGHVRAGFHEVVCTEDTQAAAASAAREGRPTWRVSSTVFSQIASDQVLQPLGRFATPGACAAYPAVPAGKQVQDELSMIALAAGRAPS